MLAAGPGLIIPPAAAPLSCPSCSSPFASSCLSALPADIGRCRRREVFGWVAAAAGPTTCGGQRAPPPPHLRDPRSRPRSSPPPPSRLPPASRPARRRRRGHGRRRGGGAAEGGGPPRVERGAATTGLSGQTPLVYDYRTGGWRWAWLHGPQPWWLRPWNHCRLRLRYP